MKKIIIVISAFLSLVTTSSQAFSTSGDNGKNQKEQHYWKPPTPEFKQKFDWIRLTSDEWLKGDIIAMYGDELEFDSDKMGLKTFDWDDVAELRSKDIMSIRMNSGMIAEGYLVIKDGTLTLIKDQQSQKFNFANLLSIASSEKNKWDLWDGSISLGANIKSGNTDQLDYNISADAKRRTSTSRFISIFTANFSRSKDTGKSIETADSKRLTSYYDWFFSQKIFFRAADFEYFSDEFQNIQHRVTLGVGIGYHVVDTKRAQWDVTVGPSYQRTRYNQVEEGESDSEDSPVIMLGTLFEYEVTSDIDFETDYQLQIVNKESGEFIHHLHAGVEIELVNDFDLDVSFYVDRTEKPKPDEESVLPDKNDYRLVVSLGYKF